MLWGPGHAAAIVDGPPRGGSVAGVAGGTAAVAVNVDCSGRTSPGSPVRNQTTSPGSPGAPQQEHDVPQPRRVSRPPCWVPPHATGRPGPVGLYDPDHEHDACGVSFVVDMHGRRSHDLVGRASRRCATSITAAPRAPRRTPATAPASSSRSPTGSCASVVTFDLPAAGSYAVGIAFLPPGPRRPTPRRPASRRSAPRRALEVLGWRDVPDRPVDDRRHRRRRHADLPPAVPDRHRRGTDSGIELDRRAFVVRKRIEHEMLDADGEPAVYFPSLSSRTIVYKGMLTTPQLGEFFPDLADERFESALAWCTRGSRPTPSRRGRSPTRTATSPTTARSTPCRATRTGCGPARRCSTQTCSPAVPARASSASSRSARPAASDTARLDEALELLHLGGYSLPHAVLMMIPEAWENHPTWTRPSGTSTATTPA